jgi:CelD/BcsL family acetyltransferase involved in cellulose biosynthesis
MNMHAATGLVRAEKIEIVRDDARLRQIAPAWDALWERADGLVFQSHGWIWAWWEHVGDPDRRKLRIGLVWNGDRLEAVMPLTIHHRRGLRFLEWAANSYSDYEDILVAPHCPTDALDRLWNKLREQGGYDVALLNRLRPEAQACQLASPTGGKKLRPNHRFEVAHRVSGNWPTGAAWFESQNKKARQNHRRGEKALSEAGAVRFRLLGTDEPLAPVLERLAALKRQWLAARGFQSELFAEDTNTLNSLVNVLREKGILRLFVLEVDGLIVAVSVNFVQRGTLMAFVTTYDPAFERASPGTLLINDYIMWAFDHGLSTVDFLCGAEAFKLRFATETQTLGTLVGAGSLRGQVALGADRLKHKLDHWREERATTAGQP